MGAKLAPMQHNAVDVGVTTDEQGRYIFPKNRLSPGEYSLSIRAVGYDIKAPTKATRDNPRSRQLNAH
jgi:virginiamycin B lyase